LRRQIAALSMQLSATRAELAEEQQGRANDADEIAKLLDRVAGEDAVVQTLRDDLARERAFVEELRVSVQEKYNDCSTLRQRLADAESLIAKELDDAADRHALVQRAERAEQDLAEVRKQLDVSRTSEDSARSEIAKLGNQLEELRRVHAASEVELGKANQALKSANMKAFAANRQLESWKSESLRMIEQTRAEQGAVVANLTAEHARAVESVRREASEGSAALAALRQRVEAAAAELAMAAKSLEGTRVALSRDAHGGRGQSAPKVPPAAPSSGSSLSAPTRPAIPAALVKKAPPPPSSDSPILEVSELDVKAEDLIDELMKREV
jgi:chromosome segregation ATPase